MINILFFSNIIKYFQITRVIHKIYKMLHFSTYNNIKYDIND